PVLILSLIVGWKAKLTHYTASPSAFSQINPRDTLTNSAGHFVRKCSGRSGDLFSRNCKFSFPTQEGYFVFCLYSGHVGDVDECQVHGDTADDGRINAADYRVTAIRKRAHVAVIVANRNGGNQRLARSLKGAAVADCLALGNPLEQSDARVK